MIVLIHTSKTMRPAVLKPARGLSTPQLLSQAQQLHQYLTTLSAQQIETIMHVSATLAGTTKQLLADWTTQPATQRAAIDSFLGDIYSGLQAAEWTGDDRRYAQKHLRILSGLYGILRPQDGISPYRFEMGYKTPGFATPTPYVFWGETIARTLPENEIIIDLSAVEYGKTVTKYVDPARVITPCFLTISPKTGEPTFVVVHAKIARGAFASWMIRRRIDDSAQLSDFTDIGYQYDETLSTAQAPVFVCRVFGGLGLSVRLT